MYNVYRVNPSRVWRQGQSYAEVQSIAITTNPISLTVEGGAQNGARRFARSLAINRQKRGTPALKCDLTVIDIIIDANGAFLVAQTTKGKYIEIAAPFILIDGEPQRGHGFADAPPFTFEAVQSDAVRLDPEWATVIKDPTDPTKALGTINQTGLKKAIFEHEQRKASEHG